MKKRLRALLRYFLQTINRRLFDQDYLGFLIKRGMVVGKNFNMLDEVIIDGSHCWHITIGDDVTLAPRVYIFAHDASTRIFLQCTRIGKVTIGNRVFIGASSVILPGVTIGNDVIIGAGSVVSNDIPDGVVAAGNPAKVIESISNFLEKRKIQQTIYPCFPEKYTVREHISDDMKIEMNLRMKDKFGFLIKSK